MILADTVVAKLIEADELILRNQFATHERLSWVVGLLVAILIVLLLASSVCIAMLARMLHVRAEDRRDREEYVDLLKIIKGWAYSAERQTKQVVQAVESRHNTPTDVEVKAAGAVAEVKQEVKMLRETLLGTDPGSSTRLPKVTPP